MRLKMPLDAAATVAPDQRARVDQIAVWDRIVAHGIIKDEVALRASVSRSYLSEIMAGRGPPRRRACGSGIAYPYRTGYDGRVSVTPVFAPLCACMLKQTVP